MSSGSRSQIVAFDYNSKHLHRFDHSDGSLTEKQGYPGNFSHSSFSAASLGQLIFIFIEGGSAYKLDFDDTSAQWEKIANWVGDHQGRPPAIASSNAIFLVGNSWNIPKPGKSVSKYKPSLNTWSNVPDKPTATQGFALHCNDAFLYCFGGTVRESGPTKIAERLDLSTETWTEIAPMKESLVYASAAEWDGKIFVFGQTSNKKISIERYDPHGDQWEIVSAQGDGSFQGIFKTFALNGGDIFLVSIAGIQKYSINQNKWSQCDCKLHIEESVLTKV